MKHLGFYNFSVKRGNCQKPRASQVALVVKNPPCQGKRHQFDPWFGTIPWRRKRQPTPVLLPGEFHRQSSLAGYSPRGLKESDTTEATEHSQHIGDKLYSHVGSDHQEESQYSDRQESWKILL